MFIGINLVFYSVLIIVFYFLFFFIFERVDCYFWLVKFFFVIIKKLMIYEMCIKIE